MQTIVSYIYDVGLWVMFNFGQKWQTKTLTNPNEGIVQFWTDTPDKNIKVSCQVIRMTVLSSFGQIWRTKTSRLVAK